MELFGVVYMSRATRAMSSAALDQLLLVARANNAMIGITGVLLYGDGRFFQYFEGEHKDVVQVYSRILASPLHTDLVELEYRQIPERLLRKWFMGFREAPPSLLQKLSHDDWARERPWVEDQSTESPGMQQLLNFLQEGDAGGGMSP
jgi:hypothetical protein